jgi:hypothetical protein
VDSDRLTVFVFLSRSPAADRDYWHGPGKPSSNEFSMRDQFINLIFYLMLLAAFGFMFYRVALSLGI